MRYGIFTVKDVFLRAGSASVEAGAQRASNSTVVFDRVPVSVDRAEAALLLSANPSAGSPPMSSTLRLSFNKSSFPVQRLDFDFDGDGQLDRIAADSSEVTAAFSSARPFMPRSWVTLPSGVELSASVRVLVDLPTQTGAAFAQGNPVDLHAAWPTSRAPVSRSPRRRWGCSR